MINLPTVTVVCITTKDYGPSILALKKTLEIVRPFETLYFSDIQYTDQDIKWIPVAPFRNVDDYNHFVFKKMVNHIQSEHILVVQHDGMPICESAWTSEFLDYDYIGAPWNYHDGRNVGNGGFSLRSKKLHLVLQKDEFEYTSPEDEKICRYYRQTLERKYGIKFAPEELAHQFSYEMHRPTRPTFGSHNSGHPAYREPIVLRRTGAMGDVIMLEPVMEWFFNKGYRVILDTQPHYYNLFAKHYFQIELLQNVQQYEDTTNFRVINLDMSYEVEPKELVLKTYYKFCGIADGEPKLPRLNFHPTPEVKLFEKYVVLHTDDTAMAHRNIHGVDWDEVANYIQVFLGYPVFRVGVGNGQGGTRIQTFSENMLAYIISGANYFIGIDSGPSQIAVATGVKSLIFFGSVNPRYRYDRFENIHAFQKPCPVSKAGCYHDVVSVKGQDCQAHGFPTPPCITWNAVQVIAELKKIIQSSL